MSADAEQTLLINTKTIHTYVHTLCMQVSDQAIQCGVTSHNPYLRNGLLLVLDLFNNSVASKQCSKLAS